jgi:protein-disulfide isomerase
MNQRFESALSVMMTVCALIVTGIMLRDGVGAAPNQTEGLAPEPFEGWSAVTERGHLLGREDAKVAIVVFVDYECPFCRVLHMRLDSLLAQYPNDVSLRLIDFPLSVHKNAATAALAAQCSAEQGVLGPFAKAAFLRQESLQEAAWADLAGVDGEGGRERFDACMKGNDALQLADTARAFARGHSISGTPTLLMNGWRLRRPPTLGVLSEASKRVLAGKPAF